MLFNGLRLLVTNWRLMLVQALPAMWIWAATVDLKAHVLRGKEFAFIRGPVVLVQTPGDHASAGLDAVGPASRRPAGPA